MNRKNVIPFYVPLLPVGDWGKRARREEMSVEQKAAGKEEEGKLQKGIAEFYDESSGIWENIWGDHMHHGFYDPDSTVSVSDHRAAQIRMIQESLRFASLLSGFTWIYFLKNKFDALSVFKQFKSLVEL